MASAVGQWSTAQRRSGLASATFGNPGGGSQQLQRRCALREAFRSGLRLDGHAPEVVATEQRHGHNRLTLELVAAVVVNDMWASCVQGDCASGMASWRQLALFSGFY